MITLIKNGLVYDGTGDAPAKKDILIRGNHIAKFGTIPRMRADTVIDASGAIIAPGFIDINAHSDHYLSLFYEPHQEDFIRQGITTIIGGNCGVSLAPLINGSLESIREWGNELHTNVHWKSVKEFFSMLTRRGVGINFGMLVGHLTVRRMITNNSFRDLTEQELALFKTIITHALKDGALGLSTGLEHMHGIHTPYHELQTLVREVSRHGGVYATHLRNAREGLLESIEEVLSLAEDTHANIEILHLQPLKAFHGMYKKAVEEIEKKSSRIHVNFDINPCNTVQMLLHELLPKWLHEERLETMWRTIKMPVMRPRILSHIKTHVPRDCKIIHIPIASLKFLEGHAVKEFGIRNGLSYEEAVLKLMDLTRLRATIATKTVDEELLDSFLAHPNSIISSNSASFGKKEFKYTAGTDTFPSFLKTAAESNILNLEKAIEKTTSIPAKKYKIQKRGQIKEGYFADIVILEKYKPTHVFLNGFHVLNNGAFEHALKGAIIKHS